MSGYLASVARRVLAPPNLVRPRVASPFEPGPPDAMLADQPTFGSPEPAAEQPLRRAPGLPSAQHADAASDSTAESSLEQSNAGRAPASTTEADPTPRPARTRARSVADPQPDRARRERTRPLEDPPARSAERRPPRRAVAPAAPAQVRSEKQVGSRERVGSEESAADRSTVLPVVSLRAAAPARRSSLPAAVAAALPASVAGRRAQPSPATSAADAPVVRVSIGRIEVRATPVAPPVAPAPPSQPAHVSLAEYLRRRDAGER